MLCLMSTGTTRELTGLLKAASASGLPLNAANALLPDFIWTGEASASEPLTKRPGALVLASRTVSAAADAVDVTVAFSEAV